VHEAEVLHSGMLKVVCQSNASCENWSLWGATTRNVSNPIYSFCGERHCFTS